MTAAQMPYHAHVQYNNHSHQYGDTGTIVGSPGLAPGGVYNIGSTARQTSVVNSVTDYGYQGGNANQNNAQYTVIVNKLIKH
jgi:hypothetical protein